MAGVGVELAALEGVAVVDAFEAIGPVDVTEGVVVVLIDDDAGTVDDPEDGADVIGYVVVGLGCLAGDQLDESQSLVESWQENRCFGDR